MRSQVVQPRSSYGCPCPSEPLDLKFADAVSNGHQNPRYTINRSALVACGITRNSSTWSSWCAYIHGHFFFLFRPTFHIRNEASKERITNRCANQRLFTPMGTCRKGNKAGVCSTSGTTQKETKAFFFDPRVSMAIFRGHLVCCTHALVQIASVGSQPFIS